MTFQILIRNLKASEKSGSLKKVNACKNDTSLSFFFFFWSRGSRTKHHDAAGGFDACAGCGGIATQPYIFHIALTTLRQNKITVHCHCQGWLIHHFEGMRAGNARRVRTKLHLSSAENHISLIDGGHHTRNVHGCWDHCRWNCGRCNYERQQCSSEVWANGRCTQILNWCFTWSPMAILQFMKVLHAEPAHMESVQWNCAGTLTCG